MRINGVDIESFDVTCSHPGCHELYGDDDPRAEYRHLSRTELIDELRRQEAGEVRPLMQLALLALTEAAIRGEGGREAFRRIRVASMHP